MSKVHWLGAGLSTFSGIRRLAELGQPMIVWNRTASKASAAIANTEGEKSGVVAAAQLDWNKLESSITAGDVLVSMLPGDLHVKVANLALQAGAHFVSSSYISPDMQAMQEKAVSNGVALVNEVGLDPGIDHLFAHALVEAYKKAEVFSVDNSISFRSYCGGVPAVANAFRYKFSWSPFGVLKALTSPAQWIQHSDVQSTDTPWKAVTNYKMLNAKGKRESFEAYPNRDSLPFMNAYHFEDNWQVEEFVRGTLRLDGWSKAWSDLFKEIEDLDEGNAHERLTELSDQLWAEHAYLEDEKDRVLMAVELEVKSPEGKVVWHQTHSIDDQGNDEGTSMARLVSHTVSLAVQGVLAGNFAPGVHAAPSDAELVASWLGELDALNGGFSHTVVV